MKFLRKYKFALLAAVCVIAISRWLGHYNDQLKTAEAANKIVSLELAFGQKRADDIVTSWEPDKTAIAITSIEIDYLFIIVYTFLFISLIYAVRGSSKALTYADKVFIFLALASGLLDVVENVFMTLFIQGTSIHPVLFSVPATIKFACIVVVSIYILRNPLRHVSTFLSRFASVCWANRIIVVILVVLFGLMQMDQGQDLLVNLNSDKLGPISFYSIVTLLGVLHWFLPKYYMVRMVKADVRHFFSLQLPSTASYERYIPRLLGAITFILPACSILTALNVFQVPYWLDFISPMLLFVVATIIYAFLLHQSVIEHWLGQYTRRRIEGILMFTSVAALVIIAFMGFFNSGSPSYLAWLSFGLFILSVAFLIVTTGRTLPGIDYQVTRFQSMNVSYFVFVPALTAAMFFLTINIFPFALSLTEGARFMTLPFVLTGLVFYGLFFSFLLVLGRSIRIQLVTLLFLLALIMASSVPNNFHNVRTIHTSSRHHISLDTAITAWLKARHDIISHYTPDHPYPTFVVNTYGGGIRAAAWTGMVTAQLDSMSSVDTTFRHEFQSHVLAFSGASGGTVGASVACALRKVGVKQDVSSVKDFYRNDFLTPVLTGLIGRDVLFSTLGMGSVKDRAALQEEIWESMVNKFGSSHYSKSFDSLWYDGSLDTNVPLLFSNTYYVEEGLKSIYAPYDLKQRDFPSTLLIRDSLKIMTPLSTGAFLSARFPLISPAGMIPLDSLKFHFMDGGLKENSGAETALQLIAVFNRNLLALQQNDSVYRNVRVHMITLNNAGIAEPPGPAKNIFQLSSPLLALYTNWLGNTDRAQDAANDQLGPDIFEFRPLADTAYGYKPVLPLGWQISNASLKRMENGLAMESNAMKAKFILNLMRTPSE